MSENAKLLEKIPKDLLKLADEIIAIDSHKKRKSTDEKEQQPAATPIQAPEALPLEMEMDEASHSGQLAVTDDKALGSSASIASASTETASTSTGPSASTGSSDHAAGPAASTGSTKGRGRGGRGRGRGGTKRKASTSFFVCVF